MLALPVLWLVLFAILLGWGLLVISALRRFGGAALGGVLTAFQTMWLGYAALLAFAQLTSLLLPVAAPMLALSIVPALAGFALRRRDVAHWIAKWRLRPRVAGVCAGVLVATSLVVAYPAANAVSWYDTGLYHLDMVKWLTSYPAVPGLANLHLRLGYNNSSHVFAAYTDVFWEGAASHIANGFLMAALCGQWFVEILAARTPRGRVRQVFCMLTLPFLLAKLWTIETASLSSDLPAALFCFLVALELVSLPARGALPVVVVTTLAAVALTTKLVALAPCAVVVVLALVLLRRERWRIRVLVFALPALVMLGWMLRGVVLSGWLVFPAFGKLPVEWAVRSRVAAAHMHEIQQWGRGALPDGIPDGPFYSWFVPWLTSFRATNELGLFICAVAGVTWRLVSGPVRDVRSCGYWAAVAGAALGIAQWFWGAPGLRYGAFLFWMLAAATFTPFLVRSMRDATARTFMLVLCLGISYWAGGFSVEPVAAPLVGRLSDPPVPATVSGEAGTRSPASGDQCWNAPLMCTPTPGHLRWRDAGDVSAGFVPK